MDGEAPNPHRGEIPNCFYKTTYSTNGHTPDRIYSVGAASGKAHPAPRASSTEEFRRWRLADPGPDAPDPMPIGELSPPVLAGLRRLGHAPSTALVTVSRRSVDHALRDTKAPGQLVAEADIDRLPEIVARPRAVLFETQRDNPMLLYVFDGPGRKAGKIVVRVRRPADREKETNRMTTAGYVERDTLEDRTKYTLLDGALDDG